MQNPNDVLIRPKPLRNDPKYAERRNIDFSSTKCECYYCEYQEWWYNSPEFHRNYAITNEISCVIARSNSKIIECDNLIDETMNDDTVFDCILICDLLVMKESYIYDLEKVRLIYLDRNWNKRKAMVSFYDSHSRSQHDENHVEKYLFSEFVLREICSFDPTMDIYIHWDEFTRSP